MVKDISNLQANLISNNQDINDPVSWTCSCKENNSIINLCDTKGLCQLVQI